MDSILAHLPAKLQLDWCLRGFEGIPWFLPGLAPYQAGTDTRALRVVAEAPIEAVEAVDPVAMAMLGAWLLKRGADGAATRIDDSAKSVQAFKSGLLRVLSGKIAENVEPRTTPSGSTLLFPTHVAREPLIEPFIKQIGRSFGVDQGTIEALKYCLSELLRNVFEHAESPGAVVAAGHYPKAGRLTIAIADLGIGVPEHMRRKHGGSLDEESSLRAALEPLASGSFDLKRNAGLGLYMTRRLADMVGGKLWLLTGNLCARHDGDESPGGRAEMAISHAANAWKGTVVALTLTPGKIRSFDLTMRRANEELRGGAVKSDIRFSKKADVEGAEIVEVKTDVGNMSQNKIAARALCHEKILPALREGKTLVISFHGVALTTQSFIHALLAEPLRFLGPQASLRQLVYARSSDQVREVIRLVVGYVLESEEMREDAPAD